MAWLASADRRARRWPRPLFWLWRGLVSLLAILGAYAWIGMWFQRDPWLGAGQFVLCAYLFWHELKAWPAPDAPAPSSPPPAA